MSANIGQKFIKETSYLSDSEDEIKVIGEPFPENPKFLGEPIELPAFEPQPGILKLIESRRSVRQYENKPISLEELSKIIWGTQGVTAIRGASMLRSVASAGNRHPLNTYIAANRVDGLDKAVYFYDRLNNCLIPIRKDDYSKELNTACLDQTMVSECSAYFIWTAVTARTTEKYQARGYRYIFLDVGHIGGQLQLICQEMGLGSCNIAAFLDDSISKFLGLGSEFEVPVYMATVGVPKSVNS